MWKRRVDEAESRIGVDREGRMDRVKRDMVR